MRPEHNHNHRTRTSTNGSSQNGSSPHTNGSVKGSDTNGFHTNGSSATDRKTPYHGHNREEVTRILLQSLSDLGYHHTARHLSHESGYELEIPSVAAFRNAVQNGEWEDAEALLFGTGSADDDGGVDLDYGHRTQAAGNGNYNGAYQKGLPLADGADTVWLKFLIRQQKYLELLELRDFNAALIVLRSELTPLKRDVARLHILSSLMMCPSAADLRTRAEWDGAAGESRSILLSRISQHISPAVMIPEHRLASLLHEVQEEHILGCHYHNTTEQPSLYTDHECSADDFPLHTMIELSEHTDEVWRVEFSPDGTMLATAGRENLVCIYNTSTWRLQHEIREHDRNNGGQQAQGITYIAFSPDSRYLISCAYSREFVVINLRDGTRVAIADHFDYPVTSAAWLPDSQTFVVGTQATQRPLSLYSLRHSSPSSSGVVRNNEIHSWRDPIWNHSLKDNPPSFRVSDCAVSRDGLRLAAATTDRHILIYDLRTYVRLADWKMDSELLSICYSEDSDELLVNMTGGRVVTLNSGTGEIETEFEGIKTESKCIVRSCYGGAGNNLVVSGSEDSCIYIWGRKTGRQVAVLEGHQGIASSAAWHPKDPGIFASAGDDRRVRIWASASRMRANHTSSRPSLGLSTGISTATRPNTSLPGAPTFSP